MEDISRELEREIAQSKPKPYKKDQQKRILIVDDFGRIKSGEFLNLLVKSLAVASVVCFVLTLLFFKLYIGLAKDTRQQADKLAGLEKKVESLTREKEILMARLVMAGKSSETAKTEQKDVSDKSAEPAEKKTVTMKKKPEAPPAAEIKKKVAAVAAPSPALKPVDIEPIKPALNTTNDLLKPAEKAEPEINNRKIVAIEKFTVTKDSQTDDLLVRFDIRNTSKKPGDVSGRIFTVLQPEATAPEQWLVVPTATLKDGKPVEFRKGQYFSIAHFKPVKFRIRNTAGPDFFKTAAIYIFNNQGELIFEEVIKVTGADES